MPYAIGYLPDSFDGGCTLPLACNKRALLSGFAVVEGGATFGNELISREANMDRVVELEVELSHP